MEKTDGKEAEEEQAKTTMRCVVARRFGSIDDVLEFVDDFPRPKIERKSGQVLVRVQAVSFSPSDYRMVDGSTDFVKKPNSFPYIPGGDVCGIVHGVDDPDTCPFKVGDSIVATWDMFGVGGLAEYLLVNPRMAAMKPATIDPIQGAAMANSPVHAMIAVERAGVKRGDRVLVLGGSGGVGSSIVQLVRTTGASFVAATSTRVEFLMETLGVDRVIDYRRENWWYIEEFIDEPFDKIFDCAEGAEAWVKASRSGVLKSGRAGGVFYAIHQSWHMDVHSVMDVISLLVNMFWKQFLSRVRPWSFSKYVLHLESINGEKLAKFFDLQQKEGFKCCIDPACPFPFTIDGVKRAFKLHASHHALGKVVVLLDHSVYSP